MNQDPNNTLQQGQSQEPVNLQEPTQQAQAPVSSPVQSNLPQAPQSSQSSSGIDPTIINLAKAIRDRESGGDYNAVGDAGTSTGAFQFQPETWKLYAGQILGDQNAPMTKQNQNAVVYGKLKQFKNQGWTAAQSVAAWNAGEGKAQDGSWTTNVGTTTINGKKISYNTPQYVKDVMTQYQKYKGQSQGQSQNGLPSAPQEPQQATPSQSSQGEQTEANGGNQPQDTLGSELGGRYNDFVKAYSDAANGKINPVSGALQSLGAIGGGITDVANAGLKLIPGVSQLEGLIGQGVQGLAKTGAGQSIIRGVNDFSQAHPELSSDIGAVGNIVGGAGTFLGAGALKDAVGGTLSKVLGKDAISSTIADVAPKETAGTIAKAVQQRGTTKSFLSGRIGIPTDPKVTDLAKTVVENVPGFTKAPDLATKINLTQDASQAMADKLKQAVIQSGQDRIYPFRELAAKIQNAEEPISLKGTEFEKQIQPLKQAVLQMAQKNGGTILSLFDTTKQFDALVNKTWPNLWDKENAPMRDAVKSVRDTINNYIDDNLPPDVQFKQSRLIQHKLIKATTNMSKKLASGVDKEIGTTRFQRFGMRHPVLKNVAKKGIKYGLEGAGLGAGATIYNDLRG